MSTIRVQTAHNVAVEYEVASIGDRMLARVLDWLVLMVYGAVVGFLINRFANFSDERRILQLLFLGLPWLLYDPLSEIFFNGQTVGKRMRHIKVTRRDGTRPQVGDYLLRWLLGLIEIGACFGTIATVAILFNGRGQRLGDMAANTMVVSLKPGNKTASYAFSTQINTDYIVVFPQAALLSDRDIDLVRRLMGEALKRENYLLLNEVANKVKAITGIQVNWQDEQFLQTILQDYAHLMAEKE